jgi:c-di-AMP phosphodiesterase-like protein
MQAYNRRKTENKNVLTGSLKGKHPVILDNGRTIIYISDNKKEAETRKNTNQKRIVSLLLLVGNLNDEYFCRFKQGNSMC